MQVTLSISSFRAILWYTRSAFRDCHHFAAGGHTFGEMAQAIGFTTSDTPSN